MKSIKNWRRLVSALLTLITTAVVSQAAHAHLMAAQHGTLNFVGSGAFMVLSLPVSAFGSIDADGDGRLSKAEFSDARTAITATIKEKVRLLDSTGARPLDGIMLTASAPHGNSKAPANQIIVMGRFALKRPQESLRFEIGLYGKTEKEKAVQMRFSRKSKTERDVLTFTLEKSTHKLFAKP